MAKTGKRGHDEVETYDSDGGFVSNDDGNAPKSKKTKKARPAAKSKSNADNKSWELSSGRNPRRVEITEFKGQKLVNIREYYEKDGEFLPGKKGISLTADQYKALVRAIPQVNTRLSSMGVDVSGSEMALDEEESEAEAKPKKRVKPAKESTSKSNIEATSEEDDE